MILRGSTNPEPFLATVERYVAPPEPGRRPCLERLGDDDILYLGGGYWRARVVRDDDDKIVGVRLINPDRTWDEIQLVERAVAILARFEYVMRGGT